MTARFGEAKLGVDLYWLPLGAGGYSVRLNGRVFEAIAATVGRRDRRDLYHSALVVRVPTAAYIIEQGPVRDVLRDPQHPYTRGLLASLPGVGRGDRLRPIDGAVPMLGAFPSGCTFHPRCADRFDVCASAVPGPVRTSPARMVRCFLHDARYGPAASAAAISSEDDGAR